MGKSSGKKKKHSVDKIDGNSKPGTPGKVGENVSKVFDEDTLVFIAASQELKDEGNKLFQKRDYEGAMLKYEKALKLLPRNHIDVAYIRSNMAACYMQMGIVDYPRAVHECNLALEVSPRYTKALIKRARCYEGLNRFELAVRDINSALSIEPHNMTALEVSERLKQEIESQGNGVNGNPLSENIAVEPPCASSSKPIKQKTKKKKGGKKEENKLTDTKEIMAEDSNAREEDKEERRAEDKLVVEEKFTYVKEDKMKKTVKLVFGEDIRLAQLPVNCSLFKLREVIKERYPNIKPALVKYKDHEGDMITITGDQELRLAEESDRSEGSLRLYIVEVAPEQDPFYDKLRDQDSCTDLRKCNESIRKSREVSKRTYCMDEWILKFAELFKGYVGFNSDAYLDLHEVGVKLYSEAMEETVTSEEAQGLFDMAAKKFQEMTALALFNWGNVHMARARKRVHFTEESPKEAILTQIKNAYERAEHEYIAGGKRYEDALRIKPDFYEAHLALAQQQYEQAKLAWYFALANDVDVNTWSYTDVLELYNNAEDNVEKGMHMWEELERQCMENIANLSEDHTQIHKIGFNYMGDEMSANEIADYTAKIRSQIYVLWGTMLYERSMMEYKLQLPVWQECFEVALEKFELAGASSSELAVMVKNHCSNDSSVEGGVAKSWLMVSRQHLLGWGSHRPQPPCPSGQGYGFGFKIDEIVQAWNEMDEAKRWDSCSASFRLEPMLKRRPSKLYSALEQV